MGVKWLILLIALPLVFAECQELSDNSIIDKDTILCSSTYDIPNGIRIVSSNIVLDCGTAVLRGSSGGIGILAENVQNITIRNCNILTFDQGLFLKNITSSLIEKNGFLKNNIGIRMIDCFENVIQKNNDKSFSLPISAVSSKFNIVMLGNRNIDRSFCEDNACNEYRDMDVCVSGDFYCSPRCVSTDSDCVQVIEKEEVEQVKVSAEETVKAIVEEAEKSINVSDEKVEENIKFERKVRVEFKIFIYIILYCIAFILFRLKKR